MEGMPEYDHPHHPLPSIEAGQLEDGGTAGLQGLLHLEAGGRGGQVLGH